MFKNNKLLVLVIIVLVVLAGLIYYAFEQSKTKPVTQTKKNTESVLDKQWQFPIIQNITSSLKKYDNVTFYSPDTDHLLWEKDGYLIYLPTPDSLSVGYCGVSKDVTSGDTTKIFNQTPLGTINSEVSKIIVEKGYLSNVLNSTKLGEYYFVQSYEKDNILCSMNLRGDISSCGLNNNENSVSMDIKCATGLNKAHEEQKQYADILNFRGKGVAIVNVVKKDNFLGIGTTDGTEGAGYILKHDKGKYIVIDGPSQEVPQCKKMNEWHVPKEIYGDCYDVD